MTVPLKLTDQQYSILESQINDIVADESILETDLFSMLGQSIETKSKKPLRMDRLGLGTSVYKQRSMSRESFGSMSKRFNLNRLNDIEFGSDAFDILPDEQLINETIAVENGKNYWEKLMDKMKKEVCSNETIRKFFLGDSKLNEAIKIIIPIVIAALGIATLNPAVMAAIVAVVSLIIKIGYKAYCEI